MRYKTHKTPEARAASILGRIKSPAKAAAARENGRKGGRPREYDVRFSLIRDMGATSPVAEALTIPSVDGWPGPSDEVSLQPGEWLEIIKRGSPEAWSVAVIRR